MKTHPKLIHVPDDVNKKVKRLAFESNLDDKPRYEREIYVAAIKIGIDALLSKHVKDRKRLNK